MWTRQTKTGDVTLLMFISLEKATYERFVNREKWRRGSERGDKSYRPINVLTTYMRKENIKSNKNDAKMG